MKKNTIVFYALDIAIFILKLVLSTTLKDSTEHIQWCLMTYEGAFDGNMESRDGEVRLCRMRIWSHRYDPTTWAKESKTG